MNFKERVNLVVLIAIVVTGILIGYFFLDFAKLKEKCRLNKAKNNPKPFILAGSNKQTPASSVNKSPELIPKPRFVLSGIVLSNGKNTALINDLVVREKDFVENAQVVRIMQDRVLLRDNDAIITLNTKGEMTRTEIVKPALPLPQPKIQETVFAPEVSQPINETRKEPQPSGETTTKEYIVQVGDSLWKIAQKELGNGNLWEYLYEFNKDRVKDPHAIRPGTKLIIPKSAVGDSANPQ